MISPWRVGQTLPLWTHTVTDDSGLPLNFTGVVTSVLLIRDRQTGMERTGTGTFAFTAPTTCTFTYTWGTADVAQAGQFELLVRVTYPSGTLALDAVPWEVLST